MSLEQAQSVTESIRRSLTVAHDLLVLAWQQRAWVPLGYDGWDAYVSAEFSDLALRPPREDQAQTIASMRAAGMSDRAISAATDLSRGTVQNRLREAASAGLEVIEGSTGTDGKRYATPAPSREERSERIAALRAEGQTVRQIAAATGTSVGTVQATLHQPKADPTAGLPELSEELLNTPVEDLGIVPFVPRAQRQLTPRTPTVPAQAPSARTAVLTRAQTSLAEALGHLHEGLGTSDPLAAEELPTGFSADVIRALTGCVLAVKAVHEVAPAHIAGKEARGLLDAAVSALDEVLEQMGGAADDAAQM
ncbi:helix-turn-helix domain-containing protein [Rothia kristinae]|uniref:helix-turn-helix domain-containing protein n=1 Tax=Rothia kristinae TaxID=37923 RepID=UPI0022E2E9EC|nr:helix-turn-helix domain-containing protein [Rothia kristinae]